MARHCLLPVCSPQLLESAAPRGRGRAHQPVEPAALAALPLLQQSTRPLAWRQWFDALGVNAPRALDGPRYELFSMLAQAATLGMGVALSPPLLIEAELASGQLVVACQARGIPVLFTTKPVVWRADLSVEGEARCWFGWLSDGRYLTLAALREAMDQYNATLLETCAALQVPCVDLSPMNGSEAYFYDDCHFTEAGARAVAQLVGPALAKLLDSR